MRKVVAPRVGRSGFLPPGTRDVAEPVPGNAMSADALLRRHKQHWFTVVAMARSYRSPNKKTRGSVPHLSLH